MKISFITENMSSNSTGRTYCLWLLAQHLGWQSEVLTTRGEKVWSPVVGTPFGDSVRRVPRAELASAIADDTDLVIAVKPLHDSLGIALRAAGKRALPLMVDVDDPDLELRLRSELPWPTQALRTLKHPIERTRDRALLAHAQRLPSIVSNPWLQQRYGGAIIPHARPDEGLGEFSDRTGPNIVFVGTLHRHKGVELLRAAIARLHTKGFSLTFTAPAPADAAPGERWVGQTSLEEGMEIVRQSDIVALPSLDDRHAIGQLPAKLIDAMMLGRAVAVSNVDPMPWAVGEAGVVFESGSVDALVDALERLSAPETRRKLGLRARKRALDMFSVAALAPIFEDACQRALTDPSATGRAGA